MIVRRLILLGSAAAVISLAFPLSVHAQPAAKVPTIGIVWISSLATVKSLQDFILKGLRDLKYVPGKTIIVEAYSAEGDASRLPALVGDLVRRKVDIIVAPSFAVAQIAHAMTRTIPIVMIDVADPVYLGLAASLSSPGGNVTGISSLNADLNGKRLELLKQAVPKTSLVVMFMIQGNPLADLPNRLGSRDGQSQTRHVSPCSGAIEEMGVGLLFQARIRQNLIFRSNPRAALRPIRVPVPVHLHLRRPATLRLAR